MVLSSAIFLTIPLLLAGVAEAQEQICRWAPGKGGGLADAAGALGCEIDEILNLNPELSGKAEPKWGSTYIVPCKPAVEKPAIWISPKPHEFLLVLGKYEAFPLPQTSGAAVTPVKTPASTPYPKPRARSWLGLQ
jgi:hypothetical protein